MLTLVVVKNVDSLLFARALNKHTMETMTAIKNIIPRMQNDNASFDVDMHRIPSERSDLTFGGYSSTEIILRKIYANLITELWKINEILKHYLTSYIISTVCTNSIDFDLWCSYC